MDHCDRWQSLYRRQHDVSEAFIRYLAHGEWSFIWLEHRICHRDRWQGTLQDQYPWMSPIVATHRASSASGFSLKGVVIPVTPPSAGEVLNYRASFSFCCFQHPSTQSPQNHKLANKSEVNQQAVKQLLLLKPSGGPWYKVQRVLCFSRWCYTHLLTLTVFFPPMISDISLACLFFISVSVFH